MGQLDLMLPGSAHAAPRRVAVRSPSAAARLARAAAWLEERGRTERLIVVAPTQEAASWLLRDVGGKLGATFGWERTTFLRHAATLASTRLAERELTPAGHLALAALVARIVHELDAGDQLGRFSEVSDRPGLPRALARTIAELRLAGATAATPALARDGDLVRILHAYEEELERAKLADRATVLALAAEAAATAPDPLPFVLLDVPIAHAQERVFLAALAARAESLLVTVPEGDLRTRDNVAAALEIEVEPLAVRAGDRDRDRESAGGGEGGVEGGGGGGGDPTTTLELLQTRLFSSDAGEGERLDSGAVVEILSAPGESREAVEIARRVRRAAELGVPFDRMAIVARAPLGYRSHLVEALRRARVPAYFARGAVRPDPAGRAFLALLRCASEQLSARRFAEYLSLGEVPDATPEGEPPAPAPAADRIVPPDEELVEGSFARAALEDADADADDDASRSAAAAAAAAAGAPVLAGTLRAPIRWEKLIVEAAVIGGRDRWERRLAGRKHGLERELTNEQGLDDARATAVRRELAELETLRAYALPLLADLDTLPVEALWGEWLDRLGALATRALRRPARVLSALAELHPMDTVGPVGLTEVRLVLERRLTELVEPPRGRRFGRVFVGAVEELRGLSFDVVFVAGLAEKVFPQKVVQDPILPDDARVALADAGGPVLPTNVERTEAERLALRLAVGAASRRVVFSYPRIDIEQSRPRTPSFYGLEVLRAAEGKLPGFDELARRAEKYGGARIGWPAPAKARDAIDEAEHDLALLESILKQPEAQTVGTARYLLGSNPHLARALRTRALRWKSEWTFADGLHKVRGEARAALDAHGLTSRSFSPTALQHFAACPYRFVLQALHRLQPREEPAALEELDPLQKGSFVHDVEYELNVRLRAGSLLPVTPENVEEVRSVLDQVVRETAARYADDLAPAIDRVWEDGIQTITADLREMLRRSMDDTEWVPAHFELSFGLRDRQPRDPASVDDPLELPVGVKLRGSIDLVEKSRRGTYRAVDYKTGKQRAKDGMRIGGGQTLQPVLYALALEALFPGAIVEEGRLYYCTTVGDFHTVPVPLDEEARAGAKLVVELVGTWLREGTLVAAPEKGACTWCDYLPVCGPYEEHRTSKVKKQDPLKPLVQLRKRA